MLNTEFLTHVVARARLTLVTPMSHRCPFFSVKSPFTIFFFPKEKCKVVFIYISVFVDFLHLIFFK